MLQNLQENTCARVSFLIKLQAEACNFIKKETLARCFPVNFAKFLRTPFPTEQLRWLLLYSTINIIKLTVMLTLKFRSSYPEVFLIRCSENMQQICQRTPMPKCDFNKVANHTSAWVFSCKFAAYFQNTFF